MLQAIGERTVTVRILHKGVLQTSAEKAMVPKPIIGAHMKVA